MKNRYLFLLPFIFLFHTLNSQNTIILGTKEVNTETAFDLPISLNNTDVISAIQFDINFDENALSLATGHLLTARASGHTLGVSTLSAGVIRVILYSASNDIISGTTGDLTTLKLISKTLPGDFSLNVSNIVVSSPQGGTLASTSQNGSLKVLGPKMNIVTTSVDFGRVPIGNSLSRSITVQNLGNMPLELTSINSITPFSIQQSFPVTIAANSSATLTALIDTASKFNDTKELSFTNTDADPLRKIQKVSLSAEVYAVNEIKIGSGAGEINTEVTIPVVIENMETFTGFQFDLLLPSGFEYVANSIVESGRFNSHSIGVSLISGNKLRFIAYSSSNIDFIGDSGELFSFKLKPIVSSGNYSLIISNAIISNATLGNTVSDIYNGSIQVNSPNLSINPGSISYGSVPITETRQTTIRLTNTGSASLLIDEVIYNATEMSLDIQLPLTIPVGTYKDINIDFTPINKGTFSQTISFRHNGASGQDLITVQASVFSPNYLMIENKKIDRNKTNLCQILLKNNDAVKGVQFDLELPLGFVLDIINIDITDRTTGFTLSASNLTETTYRVILYSVSGATLSNGDLSIIQLPISIASGTTLGSYQFNFSNIIISDINNVDISSTPLETGVLTLVNKVGLSLKVFLQGAFSNPTTTGLMNDNLRSNYLPTTSPYSDRRTVSSSVFNIGGTSGTGDAKDNIVDWVWVELRDSSNKNNVVLGQSALLQRDGDVVDIDGVSSLSLEVTNGNYYVSVKHRNHLGIITSNSVYLSSTHLNLDFTTDTSLILGSSNSVKNINGVFVMIGGDYDKNGQIQNTDLTNIVLLLGSSGYSNADLDMNGQIQNTDINNIINPNIGKGQQI
ncbi:MAG: choice-of-anchor D domain-containing protein [Flavobacteriaceae bacterium]|nr:choice-of-anchor D domain-containing protein [Flavobacteriaceae bacterium]